MREERLSPAPSNEDNTQGEEAGMNAPEEGFVSDTQKLVRKHLEDKDHVISEEDIANVRVGMVPPAYQAAAEASLENKEAVEQKVDEILGEERKDEEVKPNDRPVTPWDTIDP